MQVLKRPRCPHRGFIMLSHRDGTCRRRTKYTCHFLRFLYHNSLFITSSNVMSCAPLRRQGFLLCGLPQTFQFDEEGPSFLSSSFHCSEEGDRRRALFAVSRPSGCTWTHDAHTPILMTHPAQRAHEPRRKARRRCDAARTTSIARAGGLNRDAQQAGGPVQGMPDFFDSFITN